MMVEYCDIFVTVYFWDKIAHILTVIVIRTITLINYKFL